MSDQPPHVGSIKPATETQHQQIDEDDADLHTSLADLAALVTSSHGLDRLLELVATYAAKAIPGADGAGVTLLRIDRPDNRVQALAASDPFVA
ncbi:hypothetical protein V3G39_10030 [Dermatophilaceae bacterium Sec6.4]